MRYFFVLFFLIQSNLFANRNFENRFKALNLGGIVITDLCTANLQSLDHFDFDEIKIWSINCGNCLWQIEDQLNFKKVVLINIDSSIEDIKRSCQWIKNKNIAVVSLHDQNQSIKKQIGESFPIPVTVKIEKQNISQVTFGYWRASKH